ncbi:MAG: hypothetical protein ACJAZ2_000881 [Glaciecola sp.]|jgi:hypothetical protein
MLESIKLSIPKLHYQDKLFFIGSCFSYNIASKLREDKIDLVYSPFGIMFHPAAIAKVLERVIKNKLYNKSDFFKWDGYWFCYEHHSSLAERDLDIYLKKVNDSLLELNEYMRQTNTLFVTFGSAWGYEKDDKIVANCHQQDSKLFNKKLLGLQETAEQFINVFSRLRQLNSELKIVLTVSPVRHYKDGIIENQRSKSLLNILCHELCDNKDDIFYFPSYEYVIDYLRDYSFYKSDKVHPNEIAVINLYEYFIDQLYDKSSKDVIAKWQTIKLSLEHKSLRMYSPSNLKFKENLKNQLETFAEHYSRPCGNEIKKLSKEIIEIRQEI